MIFKNKEENIVQDIEYKGSMESNIKELQISNQGGLIAFRLSLDNLANFTSNDEEIYHHELLKKSGISSEDLEIKITFDLIIRLEQGKEYKSTIHLDFPIGNVVEEGTTSTELTNAKDFVFRRV